jgi:hypothetical protein
VQAKVLQKVGTNGRNSMLIVEMQEHVRSCLTNSTQRVRSLTT